MRSSGATTFGALGENGPAAKQRSRSSRSSSGTTGSRQARPRKSVTEGESTTSSRPPSVDAAWCASRSRRGTRGSFTIGGGLASSPDGAKELSPMRASRRAARPSRSALPTRSSRRSRTLQHATVRGEGPSRGADDADPDQPGLARPGSAPATSFIPARPTGRAAGSGASDAPARTAAPRRRSSPGPDAPRRSRPLRCRR